MHSELTTKTLCDRSCFSGTGFESTAGALQRINGKTAKRRSRAVNNAIDPLEKRVLYSTTLFTPGDLAVEVLNGTGGATGIAGSAISTSVSSPITIQEFNTYSQGQTSIIPPIALPYNSSFTPLTGTTPNYLTDVASNNRGYLTLTADGKDLVLAGYNAPEGTTASGLTTTSTTSPSASARSIAVINASGGINTTTSFGGSSAATSNLTPGGVAAATSTGGFYVTGTGATGSISGVQYVATLGATTATPIASTATGAATSLKTIEIYNGNLYIGAGTSAGGLFGVGQVGTGLPTTSGQPAYVLPGMGGNPGAGLAFAFLNPTTVYVADPGDSPDVGGVQKWIYSAGQWNLAYEANPAATSISGGDLAINGMTIGPNGVIYATTVGASSGFGSNRLLQVTDTGSTFSFVTLATAPTDEFFRGVSFTPSGAGINSISASPAAVGTGATITLSATASAFETTSPGTVTGVDFYKQNANGSSQVYNQSSGDTFVGAGVLSGGAWSVNVTVPSTAGTYNYYAIATESGGDGSVDYPNPVSGTTSGVGVSGGVGFESVASVLVSSGPTPAVGGVTLNGSAGSYSVNFGSTVQLQATGVTPAVGDPNPNNTTVYFEAVNGTQTYLLGIANTASNYTLNYSPSSASAVAGGTVVSGLPVAGNYNILAFANSSTGVQSNTVTDFTALTVVAPTLAFNQSSYTVGTNGSGGIVTITILRTGDTSDAASVAYATSNNGASTGQVNASSPTYYTSNSGTATFLPGSNTSSFNVSVFSVAGQTETAVFTLTLSSAQVIAPFNTAYNTTTGTLGATSTAKVDITASAETFNFSSPTFVVNKANDSSDTLTFSVARLGYTGDAATLNVSTYTLTGTVATGLVLGGFNNSTGVGGVAAIGTDYTQLTNVPLAFAVNQSVGTFSVPYNTSSSSSNVSFGVTISGAAGVSQVGITPGSAYVIGGTLNASGTILSATAPAGNTVLSGVPSSLTDVEISSNYFSTAFPLEGDSTGRGGSGNFGFANYQMLEFSQAATPGIYPALGQTVNTNLAAGAIISNISFSFYNTDTTPTTEYYPTSGNFNAYIIADSDATTATSTLSFNNVSTSSLTGLSKFSTSPYLLGTFSFNNSNAGYDTFTAVAGSTNNFSAGVAFLATQLNSDANFRIAIAPAAQGPGAVAIEWTGLTGATPPIVSLSTNLITTGKTPEYLSFNQSNYTVSENASSGMATVTLERSSDPGGLVPLAPGSAGDSAVVFLNTSNGTAIAGTNYTTRTAYPVTFGANSAYATFTVPIADIVPQGGDKVVDLTIYGASNSSSSYIAGLGTQSTATLTITDVQDASNQGNSFETLTYTSDVTASVEAVGPFSGSQFLANGVNGSGGFAADGAADFNDDGFAPGVNGLDNVIPSNPITAVNAINLEVYNLGGGTSGPLDVYLFTNASSQSMYLYPSNQYLNQAQARYPDPHFFNFAYLPEGLDPVPTDTGSFGTPLLLGNVNWLSTTLPGVVSVPLVNFTQATESALITDLNNDLPFQIVVTPENSTVYAAWGGAAAFSTNPVTSVTTYEAPSISFSVTELPWLQTGSAATWNSANHSLVVSGAATIVANPGAANPNITFTGSGDLLTFDSSSTSYNFSSGSLVTTTTQLGPTPFDLGGLDFTNAASVVVTAPTSGSNVLVVSSVGSGTSGFATDGAGGQLDGQLDLGSNAMIVKGGSLSAINGYVASGYNGGLWDGSTGIVSSTAASNMSYLTALGVIPNNNGSGQPLYGSNAGALSTSFDDGVVPALGDILVKYTYYGDANLDGAVNGSDYSRIDAAYISHGALAGWLNGDFNYDGATDGSDYTLMDNAFNTQGNAFSPSAMIATPTAMIAEAVTTKNSKSKLGTAVPPLPAANTAVGNSFSNKKVKASLIDQLLEDLVTSK